MLYVHCHSPMPSSCSTCLVLLEVIVLIILGEEYKLWNSSLCNFVCYKSYKWSILDWREIQPLVTLSTRWRRVVRWTLRPLYFRTQSSRLQSNMSLDGSQTSLSTVVKNCPLLPGIESRFSVCPFRNVVTISSELHKTIADKGMVRSDISKPAMIFFFTARVHTTKSTIKILAANTHCKYFLKIAEITSFSTGVTACTRGLYNPS
jgi:hypothetical protein